MRCERGGDHTRNIWDVRGVGTILAFQVTYGM